MIIARRIFFVFVAIPVLGLGVADRIVAQEYVTDGLVAFWTLDEDDIDDDVVFDVFGDNDARIVGTLFCAEGMVDETLDLDGVGNYVEIPQMGDFEEASVECWALASAFGGIQGIVSTWQWVSGKVHFKFENGEIQVHKNDGNKIRFAAELERWYHIVYTTDTVLNELKLYVDGELVAEGVAGTTPENMNERRIGSEHNGRYLLGKVDEVRIYDRVLDEDEVLQNFEVDSNDEVEIGETQFKRGDSNADGTVNLTDGVFILTRLFAGGDAPSCEKATDANDSGTIDLTDAVYLLNSLFAGGAEPAAPFAACGTDPTADELSCQAFPGCP